MSRITALCTRSIRDTLLAVSGNLDGSKGEAHPFPPDLEYDYTQHEPFNGVYEEPERYETNRRSVYLLQQRIRRHPFLDVWDGPDPNSATGSRQENVTTIHALFMMNSPFVHEQADSLSVRVYMAEQTDAERLRYAYELLLARPPRSDEIDRAAGVLRQEGELVQREGTSTRDAVHADWVTDGVRWDVQGLEELFEYCSKSSLRHWMSSSPSK